MRGERIRQGGPKDYFEHGKMASQRPTPPSFSARLVEAIERAGLTQRSLAARLGITESTVSKWTNDVNEPNIAQLRRLRETLAVSIDWLLGVPNTPPPPLVNVRKIRAAMRKLEAVAAALENVGVAVGELEGALPPAEE